MEWSLRCSFQALAFQSLLTYNLISGICIVDLFEISAVMVIGIFIAVLQLQCGINCAPFCSIGCASCIGSVSFSLTNHTQFLWNANTSFCVGALELNCDLNIH